MTTIEVLLQFIFGDGKAGHILRKKSEFPRVKLLIYKKIIREKRLIMREVRHLQETTQM